MSVIFSFDIFRLQTINMVSEPVYRVRTVMGNLEKSRNFQMVISRPGKVLEKT